ncbi:hypothetical protein N2600_01345 [Rhizobium sp. WSM1274]|uniref:hypothetical protein n=2 Tax=Rhizobium sp. WSM1274 TaxID=3138254 RepID=UPI0021A443B2|nr:hypothetical protein [Rhizobium leguminosarum]UWU28652.1 hypothetical protein N2600_01345 [Rhizobium leguminosarum bv. viciae]
MNMTINFYNRLLMAAAVLSACATFAQAHQKAAAPETGPNPLADKVRAANSRFLDVKAATSEGYVPIPCASGITGGAMGIHYVNGQYLKDDKIDLARPEAVMYEPMADGTLKLIAVEYITSKGPAALDGHLFNFNSAPNRYGLGEFYELHVWAWKGNPTGTFADMNPKVSCDPTTAPSQ